MTNEQLYLAIGVPAGLYILLTTILIAYINVKFHGVEERFNERFNGIDKRFDDMRDLWRAELRRVEEVIDARLKHLEES
jgi:hypothetical protein